jgi:hypothetical protein
MKEVACFALLSICLHFTIIKGTLSADSSPRTKLLTGHSQPTLCNSMELSTNPRHSMKLLNGKLSTESQKHEILKATQSTHPLSQA